MNKDEYTVTVQVTQPLSRDVSEAVLKFPSEVQVEDALQKVFESYAASWQEELGEDAKIKVIDVQIDDEPGDNSVNPEVLRDYLEMIGLAKEVLMSNTASLENKNKAFELILRVYKKYPNILVTEESIDVKTKECGTIPIPREAYNKVAVALNSGTNKIRCIKALRAMMTDMHLKEAKEVVEFIMESTAVATI
jgi:ribosomal protein L7/L12